jgi:hypothetical protein
MFMVIAVCSDLLHGSTTHSYKFSKELVLFNYLALCESCTFDQSQKETMRRIESLTNKNQQPTNLMKKTKLTKTNIISKWFLFHKTHMIFFSHIYFKQAFCSVQCN